MNKRKFIIKVDNNKIKIRKGGFTPANKRGTIAHKQKGRTLNKKQFIERERELD